MNLDTIQDRLNIWQYILENATWFGHGLSSFAKDGYYNIISRPIYAHNDLLQILHELGIIGATLIALFFTMVLHTKQKEKYVIITFVIISCFDFALYLPVSSAICFLVCGHCSVNRNLV